MSNKNTKKPSKNAPKKATPAKQVELMPGVEGMFKVVLQRSLRVKRAAPDAAHVRAFVAELGAQPAAIMLESAAAKAEGGEDSFALVEAQVAARGGALVAGWIVVEFEGLFLEAIPHAAWRGEDGSLVDLSASPLKENLFVEAASVEADGAQTLNRFKQLTDHPYVTAWVHLRGEEDAFQKRFYEGDEYNGAPLGLSDYLSWRLNFEAQDPEVPTLKDFLLVNIIFLQHLQTSAA